MVGYVYGNDGDVSGLHGTNLDAWIVKLDSVGNILWQKCLGGTRTEAIYTAIPTNDGNFIFAGQTSSNDFDVSGNHDTTGLSFDVWVVKVDTGGNILWQKCLGGSNTEWATDIQQTADNGYVIAAITRSNDGDVSGNHSSGGEDFWVVKLDSVGNLQWQKCLGGTLSDQVRSIQQTADKGYIVAGSTGSNDGDVSGNHGNGDSWVIKLDSVGNLQWQKCFGGTMWEGVASIYQSINGYIAAGSTGSNDGDVSGNHGLGDAWIVKLDTAGNLIWQKCLGGTSQDVCAKLLFLSDSVFVVGGGTYSNDADVSGNHGNWDIWLAQLGGTIRTSIDNPLNPNQQTIHLSPNPAKDLVTIEYQIEKDAVLTLYNNLGMKVLTQELKANKKKVNLSLVNLPEGFYSVQIIHQNKPIFQTKLFINP